MQEKAQTNRDSSDSEILEVNPCKNEKHDITRALVDTVIEVFPDADKHMIEILLEEFDNDPEAVINFLLSSCHSEDIPRKSNY